MKTIIRNQNFGIEVLKKILEIKTDKTNNIFYVPVQIQTFEGAHNPPYGEDTITFRIKGNDVKTIRYKHRDIPEEELKKTRIKMILH